MPTATKSRYAVKDRVWWKRNKATIIKRDTGYTGIHTYMIELDNMEDVKFWTMENNLRPVKWEKK